jgi:hypothetical protein
MAAHSEIGASSMGRWRACPGSRRLIRTLPRQKSGKDALLGTAAHLLAEGCLARDMPAEAMLGETLTVEGHDFVVDQEMVDAVQVYLDAVREAVNTV